MMYRASHDMPVHHRGFAAPYASRISHSFQQLPAHAPREEPAYLQAHELGMPLHPPQTVYRASVTDVDDEVREFQARALQTHMARAPDELSFQKGDILTVTGAINPLYYSAKIRGQEGRIARAFVTPLHHEPSNVHHRRSTPPHSGGTSPGTSPAPIRAEVAHAFEARTAAEISVPQGAIVFILARLNDEWARIDRSGQVGLVPLNHLRIKAETPRPPLPVAMNKDDFIRSLGAHASRDSGDYGFDITDAHSDPGSARLPPSAARLSAALPDDPRLLEEMLNERLGVAARMSRPSDSHGLLSVPMRSSGQYGLPRPSSIHGDVSSRRRTESLPTTELGSRRSHAQLQDNFPGSGAQTPRLGSGAQTPRLSDASAHYPPPRSGAQSRRSSYHGSQGMSAVLLADPAQNPVVRGSWDTGNSPVSSRRASPVSSRRNSPTTLTGAMPDPLAECKAESVQLSKRITADRLEMCDTSFLREGLRYMPPLENVAFTAKPALKGHTSKVLALSAQRDSRHLITGGEDGKVLLWNLATGRSKKIAMTPTSKAVMACALSRDGDLVAWGGADKMCMVNKVLNPTRTSIQLLGHNHFITRCRFVSGHQLLTSSIDGTLILWDAHTGQPIVVLEGHESSVNAFDVNAHGTLVVSASQDHTCRLWDLRDGRAHQRFQGHTGSVNDVQFFPTESAFGTASDDGTSTLFDIGADQAIAVYPHPNKGGVSAALFSSSGRLLFTGNYDGSIGVFDTVRGELATTMRLHRSRISSLALAGHDAALCSASWDGTLRLWRASK